MIAIDTNILVYAHREGLPKHVLALKRLRTLAEGQDLWAIPVFCLGEFLRVVTHTRIFSPPTPVREAVEFLEEVLKSPSVRVLHPGDRFWGLLAEVCGEGDARGNLVFDAQLAAVMREHGARDLLTEDRDFSRFPTLRTFGLGEP